MSRYLLEYLEKSIRRAAIIGCQVLGFSEAHYRAAGEYSDVAEEPSGPGAS